MPQPAMAMPVWPVGTNTLAQAAAAGLGVELEADRHLAQRAVRADRQHHSCIHRQVAAGGHVQPVRRAAQVADLDALQLRGRGQLGIVAEEVVEAALDVEPGLDRAQDRAPPGSGSLPPAGAMPISSVSGRSASAWSMPATTGTSESRPGTWSRTRVPARVESITATTTALP